MIVFTISMYTTRIPYTREFNLYIFIVSNNMRCGVVARANRIVYAAKYMGTLLLDGLF